MRLSPLLESVILSEWIIQQMPHILDEVENDQDRGEKN